MRDYGTIPTEWWGMALALRLDDDTRLVGPYVYACPHNTITGTFRLPDGYAAEDLGWTPERFAKAFAQLFANGFANRCELTKWVWIPDHLDRHRLANPNQRTAAQKQASTIPAECCWRAAFFERYGAHMGLSSDAVARLCAVPSRTVRPTVAEPREQPFANMDQEQERERDLHPEPLADLPAAGSSPAVGVQAKKPVQTEAKTKATREAYERAYQDVHGIAPLLPQPKSNGQLTTFIKTVGQENAPAIAEFFVRSSDRYYRERKHPIDLMLRDAPKLHTEWSASRRSADVSRNWKGQTL